MGNEDRATRAILITVCFLAVASLVMAALVQIAVHELRCVYDSSRTRLKLLVRTLRAKEAGTAKFPGQMKHGDYDRATANPSE
jgi:hypothetical protein